MFDAEDRNTQWEIGDDSDVEPQAPKQDSKLTPDEAQSLVLHHLSEIRAEASRFLGNRHDLSLDDLFQYGVIGAMEAAKKFDPAKNYKFWTYAKFWIRRAIKFGIINGGSAIKKACYVHEQSYQLQTCQHALGRKASIEELHEMSGISRSAIENALQANRIRITSLQKKIRNSDDESRTLQDLISNDKSPNPEISYADDETVKRVRESLRILEEEDPVAAHALQLQFGVNDDREMSLNAVGKKMMCCREDAKLLIKRGVRRLRKIFNQQISDF